MPRVAVVTSMYEGLAEPAPLDARLSDAQLADMVRRAVELAGPPPAGARNIIKPNIVSYPAIPGVVTDVRIVRVLAEYLRGHTTVAEGPGGWKPAPEDGWTEYADLGLELLDLNFAETADRGGYRLPRAVLECDCLATLSPLKTNKGTGVSLAMKNLFGIAPGMVYGWPKLGLHALGPLARTVVDLYRCRPPDYAILGGEWGVEGEADEPVHHNVIVAGGDALAVDIVAAGLMGFEPMELEFLRGARERGFWPEIEWRGDPPERARRPFRRSAQWEAICG